MPISSFPTSLSTVDAGELSVSYIDAGDPSAEPVVLLHGFPYDIHSYVDVVPLLTDAGFRVLVPSLRGHGSTSFRDARSIRSGQQAALGADLLAFIDALALEQPILAGYDWGARAACVVAALWPERVGRPRVGERLPDPGHLGSRHPARPAPRSRILVLLVLRDRARAAPASRATRAASPT